MIILIYCAATQQLMESGVYINAPNPNVIQFARQLADAQAKLMTKATFSSL